MKFPWEITIDLLEHKDDSQAPFPRTFEKHYLRKQGYEPQLKLKTKQSSWLYSDKNH